MEELSGRWVRAFEANLGQILRHKWVFAIFRALLYSLLRRTQLATDRAETPVATAATRDEFVVELVVELVEVALQAHGREGLRIICRYNLGD